MYRLRFLLRGVVPCCLLLSLGMARAADTLSETQVKSAVVYNLLQFVSWPKAQEEPASFSLCVPEDTSMLLALRGYQGRRVNGGALFIKTIPLSSGGVATCQALLVESGDPGTLLRAANLIGSQPVLLIGEGGSAISRGAMIGIDTDAGKVAFTVDLAALRRSGLKVSSKLLGLAKQVLE